MHYESSSWGGSSAIRGRTWLSDAVARLTQEDVPIDLSLAGGTWWWDSEPPSDAYAVGVIAKAEALGGNWLGRVARSEMGDLYRSHDVVCIPSRDHEGFSLVAAEAMACGCAVVSSGMGALSEVCGDAGIAMDISSPDQLADVLRRLSADQISLTAAQERSARRGVELTWGRAADALLNLLT